MNQGTDSVLPTHVQQASHDRVPAADTHSFEAELPKLPARSSCSRIFILLVCVGCLTVSAWACSFSMLLPLTRRNAGVEDLHEKPLPTMLRRFSHLKRTPPGTGTNEQQLRTMFPHWFANGQANPEVILFDVTLAIAQLTSQVAPAESSFFPNIDEENPSHAEDSDL